MFSYAVDGVIAAVSSSAFVGLGWIGRIETNPLSQMASWLRSTTPAIARTGMSLAAALFKTLDGSFP
jgi:hypothetical protein